MQSIYKLVIVIYHVKSINRFVEKNNNSTKFDIIQINEEPTKRRIVRNTQRQQQQQENLHSLTLTVNSKFSLIDERARVTL